ncbi:MAG: ribonucleoside-diphosphate reductase subunit alpha, partial [Parcubacteria group bacterium]|nr:ribonucleoside-diphosphate reductase subunit alpha [Parcubacteria group bacterium]
AEKAFGVIRGGVAEEKLHDITTHVVTRLEGLFPEKTPGVEDVQDLVEREIMREGFFDVAKAYIIYRYEHTKERQRKKEDVIQKIEQNVLSVTKRSGEVERFSLEKLRNSLTHAIRGIEDTVDADAIALQCRAELYDLIPTKEISRALMMTARSFIEQDPAYSRVASRLLRGMLYTEVIGHDHLDYNSFDQAYRASFVNNLKRGVAMGKLDPRVLSFDLEFLAATMQPERDDLFMYLGIQTLYDRYFVRDIDTLQILETPQAMWMRIAMGLAFHEKERRDAIAAEMYDVISSLRFVPSTPTLFHAGTAHPQLSSCYLTTVNDQLEHIFKCIGDNALLSKWSGGIGNDWTNIRSTGSLIRQVGVESQGVIPFLKIANDTTIAINRSGKRRGATCAYLEVWHYDIEDFLELRKNTGDERRRTHDMDTANWIPDLFIKRVKEDGAWTLFSPDEVPDLHHLYGKSFEEQYVKYEQMAAEGKMRISRSLKARDLWKKMITMLFETGHPWITFKDPCNIRSPQDHAGVIHSSNLCTEITLNTSAEETAVCNLGSVNLSRHVADGALDVPLLENTIAIAMRMLDNVIDVNFYPTAEAKNSNLKHRPVGLGIMGYQDALYMLGIHFDSDRAVGFADESMEIVSYYAILASSQLARERGTYPSYKGSKWDRGIFPVDTLDILESERGVALDVPRTGNLDWSPVRTSVRAFGMRNSNCLAMAPTATIANIAGCTPTIEPIYKNIYVKANVSGDFTVVNPYLVEDLKKLHLWDFEMLGKIKYHDGSIRDIPEIPAHLKEKYKEVFDIDPRWLIKAAAYRGKWVDQSQSLNIFFVGSSGKQLADIYLYAWEMGLKTTYYLRTLAASQVEKATVNTATFGTTHTRKAARLAQPMSPVIVTSEPDRVPAGVGAAVLPSQKVTDAATHRTNEPKICLLDDPTCEACQ